ncbi:UPF0042 nucleotide-binding protein [Lachnospiraceae bacterium RM5]|nr:UPF0042 nucleotide-binding protein [Lachnospiraceae bacterium RM5]
MRFVIVTGMSGAGKSQALNILEDIGFFCVDNLPIDLILKFAELSNIGEYNNVALGVDVRSGESLSKLTSIFETLKNKGHECKILFLDASNEILIKRYKETRRAHPLAVKDRLETGIKKEREKLDFLKKDSDYIIDTSTLLVKDLRKEIEKIFIQDNDFENMYVTILSFGFKYGLPSDADLIFDVRFMPNPYYKEDMKHKTGLDEDVRNYVMDSDDSREFLVKLIDMVKFLMPKYVKEGKNQLVIAIGCTGGKHRSVTVAESLYKNVKEDKNIGFKLYHRDIER